MKLYILKHTIALFLLTLTVIAVAQPNRSYYFLDGTTYGHQINPSFMPERNYVSIPAVGNISLGVLGNTGLSDFVYKYDDPNKQYGLTTFLSPTVDRATFLNNINDVNLLELNVNLTPISVGFFGMGGYNTVEVGIRSNTGMQLPYELFNFLKTGAESLEGTTYNIENLRISSNSYSNISFGHSRKINDQLTVGGKLKILLGIANVDANLENIKILLSQDKIQVESQATLDVAMKGASFATEATDKGNRITSVDMNSPSIGGFGAGLDLGATYKLMDGALVLSASALDLGFISWSNTIQGKTSSDAFVFDGFNNLKMNTEDPEDPKSLSNQIENITDDITNLTSMYEQESTSKTKAIATTINIGAKYMMPFYDKLSVGLLSSTRINSPYTLAEGRLFANVSPLKWFDFALNYGLSNYGQSLGWVMNIHPKGFNFFIGSDQMPTHVNSQFIPIDKLKENVYFGMNITFGNAPM